MTAVTSKIYVGKHRVFAVSFHRVEIDDVVVIGLRHCRQVCFVLSEPVSRRCLDLGRGCLFLFLFQGRRFLFFFLASSKHREGWPLVLFGWKLLEKLVFAS